LAIGYLCRGKSTDIPTDFALPLYVRILAHPHWICGDENAGPGGLLTTLWAKTKNTERDRKVLMQAASTFEIRWPHWDSELVDAILPTHVLEDLHEEREMSKKTKNWLNPPPRGNDFALAGPYCMTDYGAPDKYLWRRRCHHVDFSATTIDGAMTRIFNRTIADKPCSLRSTTTMSVSTNNENCPQNVHELLLLTNNPVTVCLQPVDEGKAIQFQTPRMQTRQKATFRGDNYLVILVRVDFEMEGPGASSKSPQSPVSPQFSSNHGSKPNRQANARVSQGNCAMTDLCGNGDSPAFVDLPLFAWGGLNPSNPDLEHHMGKWPGGLSRVRCPTSGWRWQVTITGGVCEILPPDAFNARWWIDQGLI